MHLVGILEVLILRLGIDNEVIVDDVVNPASTVDAKAPVRITIGILLGPDGVPVFPEPDARHQACKRVNPNFLPDIEEVIEVEITVNTLDTVSLEIVVSGPVGTQVIPEVVLQVKADAWRLAISAIYGLNSQGKLTDVGSC